MIKLSRFTDYAVVILAEMVKSQNGAGEARLAASDLAARSNLPEPTVAKILKSLTKGGVLSSMRGVNGGYGLTRTANEISVADIITAMDGPISLTDCADTKSSCALEGQCSMHGRWGKVNMAVRTALQSVTLTDLMSTTNRTLSLQGEGRVRASSIAVPHSNSLPEGREGRMEE